MIAVLKDSQISISVEKTWHRRQGSQNTNIIG